VSLWIIGVQLSGTLQVYKLVRTRLEENYAMGADFKCAQCTSPRAPFLVVGTIPLPSDSHLKARHLVHQSREPRHLGQDHHPEVSTGLLPDQDLHLLQTKVWKMRIEEEEKTRKAMKMHTILMCSLRSWREYEGIFSLLRRSSSILKVERVAMMRAGPMGGVTESDFQTQPTEKMFKKLRLVK
jgi:hypothetical protein